MLVLGIAAAGTLMAAASGAIGRAATSSGPKPKKPPINDGLPNSWYGRTSATLDTTTTYADGGTLAMTGGTEAIVTFKLAEKQASKLGTMYIYRPTGPISVSLKSVANNGGTVCTSTIGPVEVALAPEDGVLEFWVPKPGKGPPRNYSAAGSSTPDKVTEKTDCSGVSEKTNLIAWLSTGTSGEPFKTSATKLQGTWSQGPTGWTFEWCLARGGSKQLCPIE